MERDDSQFITHIISTICDYAVDAGDSPTGFMRDMGELITGLCEISNFDGWKKSAPDVDKAQLLRHIVKSDLTALEKKYLEKLVRAREVQHVD